MRLRLTIQRQSLPLIRLLWNVPANTAPQGAGITFSQFLEHVNDIVQLEAEEWGLEDYAVEVQGFECLHFSELHHLLKEDDEVLIRPLQTPDLRARKVSGRHQITEDGRHLIDGVPFGRALLRRPSRPAIQIPPRKRRRLAYIEGDYDVNEGLAEDRQLALKSNFSVSAGNTEDEDDKDDEEDSDAEDLEGLNDELQGLRDDLESADGTDADQGWIHNPRQRMRASNSSNGLGLLRLVDEHGEPFPGRYINPLLDEYGEDEPQRRKPSLNIRARQQLERESTARAGSRANATGTAVIADSGGRRNSSGRNKNVRFEESSPETPATVRRSEDSECSEDDDSDFKPDEIDESDKENAPPRSSSEEVSGNDVADSDLSSATFSEVGLSDSDETSSSGTSDTSSSLSSSKSEPDELPSKSTAVLATDSDTSSSGSSTSDSDSDSEADHCPQKADVSPNTSIDELQNHQPKAPQPQKPAGTGMRITQKRNARRVRSKTLKSLRNKGILPPDATHEDLKLWQESQKRDPDHQDSDKLSYQLPSQKEAEDLEAKREALLKSIESGGVNVSAEPITSQTASAQHDSSVKLNGDNRSLDGGTVSDSANAINELPVKETSKSPVVQVKDSLEQIESRPLDDPSQTKVRHSSEQGNKSASPTTSPALVDSQKSASSGKRDEASSAERAARRSKLDLEGSKRLLFGSLGLRAPKSKEDRSRLQEKLMKNVRPATEPKADTKVSGSSQLSADMQDESWRDKIDLQAVECCYDGIELSAPPFPFVQRWDPQQKRGYGSQLSRRNQKKRKRNNSSYYQNQYDDSFNDDTENKSPRRDEYAPALAEVQFETLAVETPSNAHRDAEASTTNIQDAQAANDQLIRESLSSVNETNFTSKEEDLPALPDDISNFQALDKEVCKPGAIVAFKKFEMENGNAWSPYISVHRTARIDSVHDTGIVKMTYAQRDLPRKIRRYNRQTGERIYGKFEMAGYSDEEGENADTSKVSIDFAELIEPILVRAAEDTPEDGLTGEPETCSSEPPQVGQTPEQQDQEEASDQKDFQPQYSVLHQTQWAEVGPQAHARQHDSEEHQQEAAQKDTAVGRRDRTKSLDRNEDAAEDHNLQNSQNNKQESEVHPSTQTRQDISQVFRDAGWRSSIGSDIKRQLELQDQGVAQTGGHPDDMSKQAGPPSLAFNGFSSPPRSDNGQPSDPQANTQSSHLDSQIPDSAPRVPEDSNSGLKTDESIDYPSLPHLDNDSSEYFPSQRQHRSVSFEEEVTTAHFTPKPISPPALRRQQSKLSDPTPNSAPKPNPEKESQASVYTFYDGAVDSDSDDLPALFSKGFENRLSQELEIKRENSPDSLPSPAHKRKYKPAKPKSTPDTTGLNGSQRPARSSKRNTTSTSQSKVYSIDDDINDSSWMSQPSLKQQRSHSPPLMTQESEVVDLTISSDPIEQDTPYDADESYKPSSSLPTGGGWVNKGKTRSGVRDIMKRLEKGRRKTQM